jgi:hypothetical protein
MNKIPFLPMLGSCAVLAALAMTGCGSGGGPRDLMLEEARAGNSERPVAMKGETAFLDGKVSAVATITRGFDRGMGAAGNRGAPRKGGSGNYEEGRRGRHEDEGAFSEVYNISGDSEEEQKEAMEEYIRQAKARRAAGSPMPPVTLRVQLENRTKEPMVIEVTEVNSDLGNFAVRPSKLTIPPGEKAYLDPMVSQLGVTSDDIPLKVAVRVGGKKETQIVDVKNVLTATQKKALEAAK